MKKIIFTIILLTVSSAYAQTSDETALKQINQNVVSSYQSYKFDDALNFAQQALDLSLKIYGNEDTKTAVAYSNMGMIFREKQKFDESVENLQKALTIYQNDADKNGGNIARMFEILANVYFLSDKKIEAEKSYLESLKFKEKTFGKESKEAFLSIMSVAKFYSQTKKFEKADEFYLKSYELAIKNFGKESLEIEQINDARACLNRGSDFNQKTFAERKEQLFGYEKGSIINSKAKKLPEPDYPRAARAIRLGGIAVIKIWIDEQGNPTQAKAICGHPFFRSPSEEAALKAKFEPALRDGKPEKVQGYIFYNFSPR